MFKLFSRIRPSRNLHKYGAVEPFPVNAQPRTVRRKPVAKLSAKDQEILAWAKDVSRHTSPDSSPPGSPKPATAQQLARRSAADRQRSADKQAIAILKARNNWFLSSQYPETRLTTNSPSSFLGFEHDWQSRLLLNADRSKLAQFDRLRNSLDHYGAHFAQSKEARDLYRANYAEMRKIFFQLAQDRYQVSPHDIENW